MISGKKFKNGVYDFYELGELKTLNCYHNNHNVIHRDDDEPALIQYDPSKKETIYTWYKDGKIYRENDKPNRIIKSDIWDEFEIQIWLNELGVIDERENGEASVIAYNDDSIKVKLWFKDGKLHRENDLPAAICYDYYIDGKEAKKSWYKDGKLHRENDLPAVIDDISPFTNLEAWHKDGFYYRESDKPAVICYDKQGNIEEKHWVNEDGWVCQRDSDEPSTIEYYPNGNVKAEYYYKNTEITHYIKYFSNGNIKKMTNYKKGETLLKEFYKNGKIKSIISQRSDDYNQVNDIPIKKEYYKNGSMKSQYWTDDYPYTVKKDGKPNIVKYYKSGELKEEYWLGDYADIKNNDLPNKVTYYTSGRVKSKSWLRLENEYSRDSDKPAHIRYNESGKVTREEYWDHNFLFKKVEYNYQ